MSADTPVGEGVPAQQAKRRLLRRDERRAQLVGAAARAFLTRGFAATSLDDVAAQARSMFQQRGVDTSGEQHTKTRKALEFFSSQL